MFDNNFVVVKSMAPDTSYLFLFKDKLTVTGHVDCGWTRCLWFIAVLVSGPGTCNCELLLSVVTVRSLRYLVSSNRSARIVSGHGHCE